LSGVFCTLNILCQCSHCHLFLDTQLISFTLHLFKNSFWSRNYSSNGKSLEEYFTRWGACLTAAPLLKVEKSPPFGHGPLIFLSKIDKNHKIPPFKFWQIHWNTKQIKIVRLLIWGAQIWQMCILPNYPWDNIVMVKC
jgi:hypothetical protein